MGLTLAPDPEVAIIQNHPALRPRNWCRDGKVIHLETVKEQTQWSKFEDLIAFIHEGIHELGSTPSSN